ncbi:hypothetical protein TRFO_38915 [Tritrichomonas foetus]|uniref:Uncharacterized protein n=1 Tax=Tritrichomonas foetus TaxID=1144522 RepID=A0A1J4J8C2_9EUKA|nr:hypothetical protein TRFO_38915 [Tritrichomonas foetus]|eukprot:OHS94937.1 hypothetical protein TRFO_38915 [Tritrichomonas foetus]
MKTITLQQESDFLIIYKTQEFPITIGIFTSVSRMAKKNFSGSMRREKPKYAHPYVVLVKVIRNIENASLQQFINACHFKEFQLTEENISDITYLANFFEVEMFDSIIQQYYNEHPNNMIFDKLIQFHLNKSENIDENEVNQEEIYVTEHLENFISNENIFKLPFNIIYRLVEGYASIKNNKKSSKALFSCLTYEMKTFIYNCFSKYQELATILLNVFEYITIDEILPFVLDKSFSFSLISNPSISALMKQLISNSYGPLAPTINQQDEVYDISIEGSTLEIGSSKSTILSGPFILHNSNIRKIKIKEGITEIKENFMRDCMSIKVIEIASTVRKIEIKAFFNCPNVDNVIFNTSCIEFNPNSVFTNPTNEHEEPKMIQLKPIQFFENNTWIPRFVPFNAPK